MVISLFISLEIYCFHSWSTVNICIAGPNRRAGYATVPRSNRWLHVTLNFVDIFWFSSHPMETGHLDMCYSLFSRTNVASVGSVFNDTRKVKVLSLPETIKEKPT